MPKGSARPAWGKKNNLGETENGEKNLLAGRGRKRHSRFNADGERSSRQCEKKSRKENLQSLKGGPGHKIRKGSGGCLARHERAPALQEEKEC